MTEQERDAYIAESAWIPDYRNDDPRVLAIAKALHRRANLGPENPWEESDRKYRWLADARVALGALEGLGVPESEADPVRHAAVEAECVHRCLDDQGIPRAQDGKPLSLWGRVLRWKAV